MTINPKTITFNSPDHDALYPNSDPVVTHYEVGIFSPTTASPHSGDVPLASGNYLKSYVTGSGPYTLNIENILIGVPNQTEGRVFIRATNPAVNGVWPDSGPTFRKITPPVAPTDIVLG